MRITIFFLFLLSSVYAQEVDSTSINLKKDKLETDKKLYESTISKESIDASYREALKEETSFMREKKDLDLSVKKELLRAKSMQFQQQQEAIIIDSDKESQDSPLHTKESQKLIASLYESEIESEIELNTQRLTGPSQFDSRIELLQLDPNIDWQYQLLIQSESVAMVVEKENLSQLAKETFILDTSKTLGQIYGLCTDEAFYNQPVAGIGTAFIISKNTMITANHVFERPLKDYIVVFGYKILIAKSGVTDYYFALKDIYYPKTITKQNQELDIVEFEVDRNFERPILEWENSALLDAKNNEIYMIGHPTGLPIKIALNAAIEDASNPYYYYTSLDSFQGNSGSPVFNFYTHKVIGILVSGEIDYKFNGNCYYSPVCKVPYCKGEKVIRIERFME